MQRIKAIIAGFCIFCFCHCIPLPAVTAYSETIESPQNYIISMGVGFPDQYDKIIMQERKAALLVLTPYLMSRTNENASVIINPLHDSFRPASHAWNGQLGGTPELQEIMETLGNMRYKLTTRNTSYARRYRDFTNGLVIQLEELVGKTELFMVDARTPLMITSPDDARNEYQQGAAENFLLMLSKYPGLTLHFLYITDTSVASEPLDGVRIDDYLRANCVNGAQRIVTHTLDSNPTSGTVNRDTAMQLIASDDAHSLLCLDKINTAKITADGSWSMSYTHRPWDETGDTILLLESNGTLNDVQLLRCAEADDNAMPVDTVLSLLDDTIILFAGDLPAGDYEIRMTYQPTVESLPKYTLTPYLLIDDHSPKVWIEGLENGAVLQRDDQTITLCTDGIHIPQSEWTPHVKLGDNELAIAFTPIAESDEHYAWIATIPGNAFASGEMTLSPSLEMANPAIINMQNDDITVSVTNRNAAVNADASTDFNTFVNVPNSANLPVHVDLSTVFEDPDGDALSYTLEGCTVTDINGIETAIAMQDGAFTDPRFEIALKDGGVFCTPLAGDGLTVQVQISAKDALGEQTPAITLSFHQHDFSLCMIRLALMPTETNTMTMAQNGTWYAPLNEEITLRFATQSGDQNLAAILDAIDLYGLPALAYEIGYTIDGSGAQKTVIAELLPQGDDTVFGFDIIIPAVITGSTYDLYFDSKASLYSVDIPSLLAHSFSFSILNHKPELTDDKYLALSIQTEIDDVGDEPTPVLLSQLLGQEGVINAADWFTDAESASILDYTLKLGEAQNVQILRDSKPIEPSDSGIYTLGKNAQGATLFDVSMGDDGTYLVEAKAFDGEFYSPSASITITVTSKLWRLIWTIVIAVLAIALVAFLIWLLIYLRKPLFDRLSVCVYLSDDHNDRTPPTNQYIPLKSFKKKGVSLLTLAYSSQQPLLPMIDAKVLADITLLPARAGAYATLSFGRNASNLVIESNGVRVPAKNKISIASDTIYICLGAEECIYLAFKKNTTR